jgi:hypothetical protein
MQRRILIALAALFALAPAASALPVTYTAALNGARSASPGIGTAQLDIDAVANTMRVRVSFTGLLGGTVAAHVHAATLQPGIGSSNAATTVPSFVGFPEGVTSGSFDRTLDMTDPGSYNSEFVAGYADLPTAEAALFDAIATDHAYFVIHTTTSPGGEIQGFFLPAATPTRTSTWAAIKALYR